MAMTSDDKLILDRLATLTTGPINRRRQELAQLDAKIAELDGKTCNGKIRPRSDKPNCWTILHGRNQTCDLHGSPAPGKRITTYVGSKDSKKMSAEGAVNGQATLDKLRKEREHLSWALSTAFRHLKNFYRALGYTVPQFPDQYPDAKPGWEPR